MWYDGEQLVFDMVAGVGGVNSACLQPHQGLLGSFATATNIKQRSLIHTVLCILPPLTKECLTQFSTLTITCDATGVVIEW